MRSCREPQPRRTRWPPSSPSPTRPPSPPPRRADAELASGLDRGPLHGIPLGIKDIIATVDAPTTANSRVLDPAWGAARRRDRRPQAARGGRRPARQARSARVRHRLAGPGDRLPHSPEPVGPGAHAGRLQLRHRRGGRGRADPGRPGHRHRRLDSWAGGLLRHQRHQADVRPGEQRRAACRSATAWTTSARWRARCATAR